MRTRVEEKTNAANGATGDAVLSNEVKLMQIIIPLTRVNILIVLGFEFEVEKACQSPQMYGIHERVCFGAKMW